MNSEMIKHNDIASKDTTAPEARFQNIQSLKIRSGSLLDNIKRFATFHIIKLFGVIPCHL